MVKHNIANVDIWVRFPVEARCKQLLGEVPCDISENGCHANNTKLSWLLTLLQEPLARQTLSGGKREYGPAATAPSLHGGITTGSSPVIRTILDDYTVGVAVCAVNAMPSLARVVQLHHHPPSGVKCKGRIINLMEILYNGEPKMLTSSSLVII